MFSVCCLNASNNRRSLLSHFSEKDTATERLNNSGAARIWKQGSESRVPPFATTLNFSHLQVSENAQKSLFPRQMWDKWSAQYPPFNRDYGECIWRASTVPASGHVAGVILQTEKRVKKMGQRLAGVLTPQLSHHLHPHCWESAVGPESIASCKFLNLNPKANCHQGCFEA